MKKIKFIYNKIFNDAKVNMYIMLAMFLIGIFLFAPIISKILAGSEINYTTRNGYYFLKKEVLLFVYGLVLTSFAINIVSIILKDYKNRFNEVTIYSIFFYCLFLAGLLLFLFVYFKFVYFKFDFKFYISKSDFGSKAVKLIFTLYYLVIAWMWILYFIFCVRVLTSINVKCSIFIATSVKTMLISITAWLAIYRYTQSTVDYFINILISFFGLLYPILDMYIYVRSEIEEFSKKEKKKFDFYNYN